VLVSSIDKEQGMRQMTRWRRTAATFSVIALVAAACGGDDGDGSGGGGDASGSEDGGGEAGGGEDGGGEDGGVATDVGITEDACDEAVNEDNGCIYLGILSDLTVGPFAALGPVIVEGQRAFWNRVNEDGGIGGEYDVDIDTYTRDNLYDPSEQAQLYAEIEPDILALAQTLGTPPTEAILPDMDADDMIGIPASWWSGWNFEESDFGLILESGYSYCVESIIGLDWSSENEGDVGSVQAVGYPGDYGEDSSAGAEYWAGENDAEYLGFVETGPNAVVTSQDAAIQQVVSGGADRVVLAVGPLEAAEIVGGAVANGFEGRFLGAVPTWNPALMESAAADALEAQFTHVGPWQDFSGDSEAHQAMQEVLGEDNLPTNDGYTFGWIWSYPMLSALEAAYEGGDLTRAGLRGVVDGLTVDYEGALPERSFGEGDVRTAVISNPDADEPLGLMTAATEVTGETADAFLYEERCSGSGG
jgi:ABC-type branched-subunit amino acid transport system substrate-binding protein